MSIKTEALESAIADEAKAHQEYTKMSEEAMEQYRKTGEHEDIRTARILISIASDERRHELLLKNILWRMKRGYGKH